MPSKPRRPDHPQSDDLQRTHLQTGDLRATAQLLTEGARGLTRLVEGVHGAVLKGMGLPLRQGRTRGITGLVYRSIEEITGWVGQGTERALAQWDTLQDPVAQPESTQRAAALAALNGVLGDWLLAQGNPLASRMGLCCNGQWLDLQQPLQQTLQQTLHLPTAKPTLLLVLHGLCRNELQWTRQVNGRSFNHALALGAALNASVVFVRYNSGLHVADNGRQLAAALQALQAHWPQPWQRLVLLGHSMGGLVARSAVTVAEQQHMPWRSVLRQMVFLGTPHHGAPLERAGHWLHALLGRTPYSAPFAALARLRSAGITDLRYGNVCAADTQVRGRFAKGDDPRQVLPLPKDVECYAVAACTAARRSRLTERLLGDGLVPLHSALGQHDQPSRNLHFAPAQQAVFYRTGHLQLLESQAVQAQLLHWLAPDTDNKKAPAD
jgi:pimeloyl-ACP methyl ester carboxylesterase